MSEQKIETHLNIDPKNIRTAKFIEPRYSQCCLLCDNTREIPQPRHYHYPWVCDDCKEAIAFVKDFMKSCTKAQDMLNEMEKANENVHPL